MRSARQHAKTPRISRNPEEVISELVGTRYRLCGRAAGPGVDCGIDCLGVVIHYFREVYGTEIKDPMTGNSAEVLKAGYHQNWVEMDEPKPDCAIMWRLPSGHPHVGVLTERGVLQAPPVEGNLGVFFLPLDRLVDHKKRYFIPGAWTTADQC